MPLDSEAGLPPSKRLRWMRRLIVAAILLGVGGWSLFRIGRTQVTPAAIENSAAEPDTRAAALALWQEALRLSDAFLLSDFNQSLPAGRIELSPTEGMSFVFEGRSLPIRVWNSFAGRVAVWSGATAQECTGGFRVGPSGGSIAAIDHSWFRTQTGGFRPAKDVARTLLHEIAHALHRVGNFGPLESFVNYWEIVRYRRSWAQRSFESAPQATSHEFMYWWRGAPEVDARERLMTEEQARASLAEHLAQKARHCSHGSAQNWAMSW